MNTLDSDRITRVAHIVNDVNGGGGVAKVVYNLLRVMPHNDLDFSVYSLKPDKGAARRNWDGVQAFADLGVSVGFGVAGEAMDRVSECADWLLQNEIQLVHTHSFQPNLVGRLAGLMCGCRIVSHYHNLYADKWQSASAQTFETTLADRSDALIACSAAVRAFTADRLACSPDRIEVVKNGVDLQRFGKHIDPCAARRALGLPSDRKLVALVGRICEQKGQTDLLRGARQIQSAVDNVEFLLAGEGKDKTAMAEVSALIDSEGIADKVRLMGYVPDVEMLFAAIDVLVMPSHWEGMPLSLLEAMAAGVPVAASAIDPILEVARHDHDARIFTAGSVDGLANEVVRLLRDPGLAKRLGNRARRTALNYDWQVSAQRLLELYSRPSK